MKKTFIPLMTMVLSIIMVILVSCSPSLKSMDEGDINHNIYPYLEFELSPSSDSYIAYVVEGAKVTSISIPGERHTPFGPMPVNVFKGFENPEDAEDLMVVYIDINVEEIAPEALLYAESLVKIVTTGIEDGQNWAKLPSVMYRNGCHFHGWKIGDTVYEGGSLIPLDSGNQEARPYFEVLVHHDAVEPTCTEEGNIEYWECPGCGGLFSDSKAANSVNSVSVPALGHLLPLVHVEAVEPTCQKEGNVEYWQCDRCGCMFSDENGEDIVTDVAIHKVNHSPKDEIYYNTVYHWHQCRWCGIEIETEPHVWGDWIIMLPATEHTKGSKYHVCSVCGYVATEDIPEHDHKPGEILEKHEATCLEGAYYVEKCGNPDCGEVVTFPIEDEPALGHTGEYIGFSDSTCTEEGVLAHIECSRCGWNVVNENSTEPMETVVIEKKPHDYSSALTVDEDKHYHLCKMCGIARIDEAAHSYSMEKVSQSTLKNAANCTEKARYWKSCECGAVSKTEWFEYGEPLGHRLVHHERVESTCKVQGTVEHWSCSVCGRNFSDSEGKNEITGSLLLPLSEEHVWDEGYQSDDSNHWHICTVCLTSSDKEGHDEVYGADNSCHWKQCSVCSHRLGENEPHSFVVSGDTEYCTVCGATKERTDSEPGFDVDPVYPAPTGEIDKTFDIGTGTWTFTLRSTNSGSVPTDWTWYVDDELQAGETGSTFGFLPPRPESYVVMCIFWNASGYGSASVTIN